MTLFEKYGGFGTVNGIVRNFYRDVLDSPSLNTYFHGIDMETLIDHQTKFLSHAMGGPATYAGRTLKNAHKHLKITTQSFNEVAEILQEALEDAGMEEQDIEAVMGIVASTVKDIVTVE